MSPSWKALQNGSDIRGVAMGGVAGEPVNFSPEIASIVSAAFASWLCNRTGKELNELRIGTGMDSRLSGPVLGRVIGLRLAGMGCQVFELGLASTPAMFMSTITDGFCFDGAIMLTASHLPFNRNGMKFFTAQGGLENNEVTALLELAEKGRFTASPVAGAVEKAIFMPVYANYLVNTIRKATGGKEKPLDGFHIVVDAGNGAGGFFASMVLKPLGADTSGSQFLDADGSFPNHIPNPESQEAMDSIIMVVKTNKADLGIIFDTDVDRAAVVDSTGKQVNRNRLVALMAAIVLDEHPGSVIVTDSITSDGLTTFIESELKGRHHRFKRGYKNVINESIRLNNQGNDSWLAIETSGHAAMRENHFLDDGAYLIAKILVKLALLRRDGRDISQLLENLKEPAEDHEFRLTISSPDFAEYGKKVIDRLPEFVATIPGWQVVPKTFEGIRVACDHDHGDGWFLLRLSLHDPVLPLNVESNSKGGVKKILSNLKEYVLLFDNLGFQTVFEYLTLH